MGLLGHAPVIFQVSGVGVGYAWGPAFGGFRVYRVVPAWVFDQCRVGGSSWTVHGAFEAERSLAEVPLLHS